MTRVYDLVSDGEDNEETTAPQTPEPNIMTAVLTPQVKISYDPNVLNAPLQHKFKRPIDHLVLEEDDDYDEEFYEILDDSKNPPVPIFLKVLKPNEIKEISLKEALTKKPLKQMIKTTMRKIKMKRFVHFK